MRDDTEFLRSIWKTINNAEKDNRNPCMLLGELKVKIECQLSKPKGE